MIIKIYSILSSIIKKVPLTIIAIISVTTLLWLTHKLELYLLDIFWFCEDDGEAKIGLYSSVLTLIGIFYGVYQLQSQTKDNLLSNEYLNQPDFEFVDFQKIDGKQIPLQENGFPKCCCDNNGKCTNDCSDDHWFNIKQIGNLPLKDLKISLFHEKEKVNVNCKERIIEVQTLNKNDTSQYKLPTSLIKEEYLNNKKNGEFFVLISYSSIYSDIKYKRIYSLNYKPNTDSSKNFAGGFWGKNILFYSVNLHKMMDNNSICWLKFASGIFNYIKMKLGLEKEYTKEKWLYKF